MAAGHFCDRLKAMSTRRDEVMERVAALPEELLDEVGQSIEDIVRWHASGVYRLSEEERAGVRRGMAAAERGDFVPDA
jgi:predicted transcriptional regulator